MNAAAAYAMWNAMLCAFLCVRHQLRSECFHENLNSTHWHIAPVVSDSHSQLFRAINGTAQQRTNSTSSPQSTTCIERVDISVSQTAVSFISKSFIFDAEFIRIILNSEQFHSFFSPVFKRLLFEFLAVILVSVLVIVYKFFLPFFVAIQLEKVFWNSNRELW